MLFAAPNPTASCYRQRTPAEGVLHEVIRDHLETFLAERLRNGHERALPRFVENQFRRYLTCGVLAHGFARFRCADCKKERLVPLACKGRGFCPSCTGRRMLERSNHLVDHVLPPVPIRQWVLSFPFELRLRLAFDHDLCRAVLALFTRAVQALYRRRAQATGRPHGRTGSVTVIQRFGSALNLNPHFHTLCLDGTFHEAPDGTLRFHAHKPPTQHEVQQVLSAFHRNLLRLLERRGLWSPGESHLGPDTPTEPPALADLYAASIQQRIATGPRAGHRVRSLGIIPQPEDAPHERAPKRKARLHGFDLHAAVAIRAQSRGRLETLCRYLLRPPISAHRLEHTQQGDIRLRLKTPYRDGTTHLVLTPIELLEKLAALVPRPHKNLLIYHGVLAPRAKWRSRVITHQRPAPKAAEVNDTRTNPTWATLMHRAFGLDVLACPCGGKLRYIATIRDPRIARRILRHLRLPAEPVHPARARAPPEPHDLAFDLPA